MWYPAIRTAIGQRPYLYVHTPDAAQNSEPIVYYTLDGQIAPAIEEISIKRLLISMNRIDSVDDWRSYPGERELACLVEKFNAWYADSFRRHGDPHLGPMVTTS
jgi:hypothetical protein